MKKIIGNPQMGNALSCITSVPEITPNILSEKDTATQEQKRVRDRLRKLEKVAQRTIDRETDIARELYKNGYNERAISVLRKRQYQVSVLYIYYLFYIIYIYRYVL